MKNKILEKSKSFYISLKTPDEVEKYAKMMQSNSSDEVEKYAKMMQSNSSDEVEKYAKMMQSNSSDNCLCHYNVALLNHFRIATD